MTTTSRFAPKGIQIDLGLAVSGALLAPGERRTHREIARFCGCHHNMIYQIEQSALKKIRNACLYGGARELGSALREQLS